MPKKDLIKKHPLECTIICLILASFTIHFAITFFLDISYDITTPISIITGAIAIIALIYVKKQIKQFRSASAISNLFEALALIQRTLHNEKILSSNKEIFEKEQTTPSDIYMLNNMLDTSHEQLEALTRISQHIRLSCINFDDPHRTILKTLNHYYRVKKILIETVLSIKTSSNGEVTANIAKINYRSYKSSRNELHRLLKIESGASVFNLAEAIIIERLDKLKV